MSRRWTNTANHWTRKPGADEVRARISAAKLSAPTRFWIGKSHTEETRAKISATKKASLKTVRGSQHHCWQGGTVTETQKIRASDEYITWRNAVWKRDGWACSQCGTHRSIVAHHIKPFSEFPELRFDVNNGQTLCRAHHILLHRPELYRANHTHT
jgi:hypothetical protein